MAGTTSKFYFSKFDAPYYTGKGSSDLVPGLFPVALSGRAYLLDLKSDLFRRQTLDRLRQQADVSTSVGEHSLNVDDLWRRSTSDWSHGAGQSFYDRTGSDAARFNTSKGIDPWTKWQLGLLNTTFQKHASTNTNLNLVVAGTRLYLTDGNSTLFTTTTTSSDDFSTVTGTPASTAKSIASDGTNIWIAYGANGIYTTTTSSSSASSLWTGTVDLVGFAKGRLIAAHNQFLYDVSAAGGGSLPTALNSATNLPATWTWVGITEGAGFIFIAGFVGDKSLIYHTSVRSDGTALDAPAVAGELPDGEIVRSIQGYLGFVVVGTDKGVRFATIDGNGNLTFGQLIDIGEPVKCFEPQDRFVWFGWKNFDGTSTGLGRLDLSVFTAPLTPAYASDLMASAQGDVTSVVTFGATYNLRAFAVSGVGVYVEDTANFVSSGQITSGQITYGIVDPKTTTSFNLRTNLLAGTVLVELSTDDGAYTILGTMSTANDTSINLPANESVGERFQVRLTLSRASGISGPTVTRETLRAYPSPLRGTRFTLPIILHEKIAVGRDGVPISVDVNAELSALQGMIDSHRPVTYQEGDQVFSVFVDAIDWRPHHLASDGKTFNGLAVVLLKSVSQEV